MLGLGLKEFIVVGVLILLLFGGSILPKLARSGAKRMKDSKETLLQAKVELEAGLKDMHGETPDPARAAEQPAPQNRTPSR